MTQYSGYFFTLLLVISLLRATPTYAFCAGALIQEIKAIASHVEVVAAVKASNARGVNKTIVLELDKKWIKLKGKLPEAEQITKAKVSVFLSEEMNKQVYFREAILTGNQGETIAYNSVTSDYWQGDEEKFTAVFDIHQPSRKPDSHISRARWDESSQAMISQVSVPVYDGITMIGTLTVGIDLKRVPHLDH